MADHHLASKLSVLRQGLSVGAEFGVHSLEALLWVAETVEESVYAKGSLVEVPGGVRFLLSNPPLRMGAFYSVRAWLNGVAVVPESFRFRSPPTEPWRAAAEVTRAAPLDLLPGVPTEVELTTPDPDLTRHREITVRLELASVAIPPLVWLELTEVPSPGGRA